MQVNEAGLSLESVFKAKNNPNSLQMKTMRFERDALTGLERYCGEIVVEMLEIVSLFLGNPRMHIVMLGGVRLRVMLWIWNWQRYCCSQTTFHRYAYRSDKLAWYQYARPKVCLLHFTVVLWRP